MKHQITARAIAGLVIAAGLMVGGLAVNAQTPAPMPMPMGSGAPGMGGPPGSRLPANDNDFVRVLDRTNTVELDQAKFIVNRTKDPTVRGFAQRMIDDHSTTAVKLEAATRGTSLRPPPPDPAAPMGRMTMMLESETGTQLDNDYMRVQVPQHQRVLAVLQWETQNGSNAGLKTLAATLTPTVQQHLQIAQAYLSAHNLSPYGAPDVLPVPGHPNPNNRGAGPGPGVPNNPASMSNGGSTSGQNNGSGGTNPSAPVTGSTYSPLGSGTPPPPSGTAAPMASPTP